MIDTSAQNTIKNSIYYSIGLILPVLLMIFVTPIIISKLGVKEYGIYIFVNTITVFLGLLDLGTSVATSKHIIEYKTENNESGLKNILYSMNSIYLIMGFAYLFICVSIGVLIQIFFLERVGVDNNYLLVFFIVGVTSFINALFSNFNNIFITIQRYDLQMKINMTILVLLNISMLILLFLGYGLISILLAQLFLSTISCTVYYFISRNIFPIIQLKYAWCKEEIVRNYKFGLSLAFNNLASSSLVHFDKLLIPIFLGNAQLTYYSVPGGVATKISQISNSFSSLLFPITVNLHTLRDTEKIKRVYIRSVRLIALLSSAIALSIISMGDKILLYWLDESFAKQSLTVLILLVLTNFVLALFGPLSNLLTAMNKMRFLTMASLIMAAINILALLILLPRYGINGAAFSYFLSVLFIFWMFHYSEKKYFGINEKIHLKLFFKLILTTIPFYIIVKTLLYPFIDSFFTLAIMGPLCVLFFVILYKLFGFVEEEDWSDFKISSTKILRKLKLIKLT